MHFNSDNPIDDFFLFLIDVFALVFLFSLQTDRNRENNRTIDTYVITQGY